MRHNISLGQQIRINKMDKIELTSPPRQLKTSRTGRLRFTRWVMRRVGDILFMKTTLQVTATGLENVPRTGPTIVLFNHVTVIEPVVVACIMPFRDMIPLGKKELYDNPIGRLGFWGWGAYPVRRGEIDRAALRRAIDIIESADMFMIAPEGHRNRDGLRNPKEGIVLLAARTGATMVPVGVSGMENYFHNLKHLRRTPVTAFVGKPFRIKEGVARKQYAQAAHEIMYLLAALITPNLRGDYADLSKATMETIEEI
jgi:1-acyl-sn-glycerol-3-phosphate acyltransferase